MNPYWGENFFGFFLLVFKRIFLWIAGNGDSLASDEVQLAALFLLSISSGLISPFLLLRKMSMLANSLSHTTLLGVVMTYLILGGALFNASLTFLFVAAVLSSFLTALMTQLFTRALKLQEDASIGLVFTMLFSLGIILVTLFSKNAHIGSEMVMGNIDAIHIHDLPRLFFLMIFNSLLILTLYPKLKVFCFDPLFAKMQGIKSTFYHYLLIFLSSLTIIASFRAVGVILVLAFLTGPYLTARVLSHRLKQLLFLTPLFSVSASMIGLALSRHMLSFYRMPLSSGSLIAVVILLQYLAVLGLSRFFIFLKSERA